MGRSKSNECRYCSASLIPAVGPETSKYALIGEKPGETEIKIGRPFVGPAGTVLRHELARLNIEIDSLLITNLRNHAENDKEKCFNLGLAEAIRVTAKAEKILLLGSECSQTFLNQNVTNISGVWLTSPLLKNAKVMAVQNPASLLKHGSVLGEFRIALEKFFGVWTGGYKEWDVRRFLKEMRSVTNSH